MALTGSSAVERPLAGFAEALVAVQAIGIYIIIVDAAILLDALAWRLRLLNHNPLVRPVCAKLVNVLKAHTQSSTSQSLQKQVAGASSPSFKRQPPHFFRPTARACAAQVFRAGSLSGRRPLSKRTPPAGTPASSLAIAFADSSSQNPGKIVSKRENTEAVQNSKLDTQASLKTIFFNLKLEVLELKGQYL